MRRVLRSRLQVGIDFVFFPIRCFWLFEKDWRGLSSLATERFDYAARYVQGKCLDVGCGRGNRFVSEFLNGQGVGVDVYPYQGLTKDNIVEDMTNLPYRDGSFSTVTFLANINHIPESLRDRELVEAWRVLRKGGNILVTMGNPLAEIIVHKVVWLWDVLFKTSFDMDSERGMHEDESYYLKHSEIMDRLERAGFRDLTVKYFWSQWGLNRLYIGWKRA